jgi:hypothetical protein
VTWQRAIMSESVRLITSRKGLSPGGRMMCTRLKRLKDYQSRSNDKAYKRDKLLKIPKATVKNTKTTVSTLNVVKVATKQHKQDLILKAEDIKSDNIRTDTREQMIANKQMSDYIMGKKKCTTSKH